MLQTESTKSIKIDSDKIIEILQKTHDGDILDPKDLGFLEHCINYDVDKICSDHFDKLYNQCVSENGYKKPDFNGVENMTRDQEGYVYYKGIFIEHYSYPWCYSEDGKNKTRELARRSHWLEENGFEVSCKNVVWEWEKFKGNNIFGE